MYEEDNCKKFVLVAYYLSKAYTAKKYTYDYANRVCRK